MNFFRCKTVACAEQRIHFLFNPRNLLLLHSKQMLTFKERASTGYNLSSHFVAAEAEHSKLHDAHVT